MKTINPQIYDLEYRQILGVMFAITRIAPIDGKYFILDWTEDRVIRANKPKPGGFRRKTTGTVGFNFHLVDSGNYFRDFTYHELNRSEVDLEYFNTFDLLCKEDKEDDGRYAISYFADIWISKKADVAEFFKRENKVPYIVRYYMWFNFAKYKFSGEFENDETFEKALKLLPALFNDLMKDLKKNDWDSSTLFDGESRSKDYLKYPFEFQED